MYRIIEGEQAAVASISLLIKWKNNNRKQAGKKSLARPQSTMCFWFFKFNIVYARQFYYFLIYFLIVYWLYLDEKTLFDTKKLFLCLALIGIRLMAKPIVWGWAAGEEEEVWEVNTNKSEARREVKSHFSLFSCDAN